MALKKKILLYIILSLVILAISFFLYYFRGKIYKIFIPFFLAVIIAYLLNPLVIRLEGKKVPRQISILAIYLVFSVLTVTVLIFIVPALINNTKDLISTIPGITNTYQSFFNRLMNTIQSSSWPQDLKTTIFREIYEGTQFVQNTAIQTLKWSLGKCFNALTMFFDFLLALIIAYYFIKDAEFFRESALSLTPRRWRNWLINTGREVSSILSHFVQGQLLTALIIGSLQAIGLFIVKVKYPLVLGLFGGLANTIPYFGPLIGAVPAVALALIDSPFKALWASIVFIIIQQLDNAFISPKIIEGKLGLHPVTTILAVLIGGEFLGIVGMLISVPLMAVLKVLVKRSVEAIV
ncbi:MAG: AI-2E family transporter [Clostridia bacterium]|nr:AI-2E family transporter [Clostridia bacterium]